VHFFALFYTVVSVATLAVQAGMTRKLLERIGIANTMAVRPAVMTIGGLITIPVMGLVGFGILRGHPGTSTRAASRASKPWGCTNST
jgi:hypothetical protein